MKASVIAGSLLTAGLVSALVAQQAQQGQTGQRQGQQDQAGQQDHERGQPGVLGQRGGQRGEENFAQMKPAQRFLTWAYKDNLFEIQLSKMVAGKVQKPEVKEFAQKLAEEHTQANQQIKQLAQQQNIQLSQDLADWQQAKLQHVSRLPADMLTNAYVFHQVGMHHTNILENRWAANNIQEQEVKTLAMRMIPNLQNHLRQAEQISRQLIGGEGGTVSER